MSAKIKFEDQNGEQLVAMIRVILQSKGGSTFDGYSAAQMFMKDFGIYGDHHLFTEVMDYMTRIGEAVCTQGWGDTRYFIN